MSVSDRTKLLLAKELKQKLKTTLLSRIKVRELCTACDVDRRTFYYHFKDIYDLTAWVFNQAVDDWLPGPNGNPGVAGLEQALRNLQKDADFYRRALAEDAQNALGRHIYVHDVQGYVEALKREMGVTTLSEQDMFEIRYYSFGCLGMIRTWLYNYCNPSPEEMAALLCSVMPSAMCWLYFKAHFDGASGGDSGGKEEKAGLDRPS